MERLVIEMDLSSSPLQPLHPQVKERMYQTLKVLGGAFLEGSSPDHPRWGVWVRKSGNPNLACEAAAIAAILVQHNRVEDVLNIISLAFLMFVQLAEPELPTNEPMLPN